MNYRHLIGGLGIVLLGLGGYAYVQMYPPTTLDTDSAQLHTDNEHATTAPRTTRSVPETWRQYEHPRFTFIFWYPPEATTTIEAGRAKVTYLGPDNTMGSEITDGFTFYVSMSSVSNSLYDTVIEHYENDSANLRTITEPREVSTFPRPAYAYQLETMLGPTVTHRITKADDGNVFTISYTIMGDTNGQYAELVNKIMASLQVRK